VEENLTSENEAHTRSRKWSESLAVGSKDFVELTKQKLGIRARGHEVVEGEGGYQLMEPAAPYKVNFDLENDLLSLEHAYVRDETD